jgi:hypothetical protein
MHLTPLDLTPSGVHKDKREICHGLYPFSATHRIQSLIIPGEAIKGYAPETGKGFQMAAYIFTVKTDIGGR